MIEFFFDCSSPWTYLGFHNIQPLACERAGVDAAAFFAGIARQEIKDQLKANTDELIRRGGFGSPTLFVNGDDMHFGNDRLPLVRAAWLRSRRK